MNSGENLVSYFPMIPEKPYAISCDRNSAPILEVLKEYLKDYKKLVEMGAGTGQHAIYMAPHFPELEWYLLDQKDRHEGIKTWLHDFPRANVKGPIEYSIGENDWPISDCDVVFTSNTLHIVSWEKDLQFFDDLTNALSSGGLFMAYGAFNYNGDFSSESNKKFEEWLKERDPASGIKDFEKVKAELEKRDFELVKDHEMPSNNRLLVFKKK